ncbi:MAG: hypothetical protein QOJ39_2614, partial [Candidatus Eremiobacteraeota bacterium]|nr:hypothetical protein [Candidatus Eremiobacteraeota bacterium]
MTVAASAGAEPESVTALALAHRATADDARALISADTVPFADVLVPLVVWARGEVARRLCDSPEHPSPHERFSAPARLALEQGLLRRLAAVAAPALQAEFASARPAGRALTASFLGGAVTAGEPPRAAYRAFVAAIRSEGLAAFVQRYPVLARLIGTVLGAWCDATVELVERLGHDLAQICARWGWHGDPGAVALLEPDLSDPHHGGRSVAALTFASGARLVYKPRSLAADAAFGDFLAWCDDDFRVPATIERDGYGWAEFIEHDPCRDAADVERFYRRAGMLLCVLYLCGTTDCHFENLIAHGAHPVLIDAETILQPQLPQPWSSGADAQERAWDTVVRTGLLPQWDFSADGRLALDTSALGSFAALQASQQKPAWRNVNTDDMTLGTEPWTPVAPQSVPLLDGRRVDPREHLDAFVDGFRRMHRSIAQRRDGLLAAVDSLETQLTAPMDDGPLAVLAAVRVRFIPRATQDYMLVRNDALRPENLASEADRERALAMLSRPFSSSPESRVLSAIEPAERRALGRLDVPHFTIAATGTHLDSGDGESVPVPVLAPGFSDLITRLRHWDDGDLRRQVAIVRGMFHARTARAFDVTSGAKPFPEAADAATRAARAAAYVAAARDIGNELEAASIPARDGSMSWLGLVHHAGADRFALEPLGYDLYGGTAGIALFFAALAHVSGESRFHALALDAVEGLRRRLRAPDAGRELAARIGIGGATGVGSIVYALTRMGTLLGEPALRGDARIAAALIGESEIERDDVFDPVAGSAGAILGLLALHHEAPEEDVLARAVAAGEHLVRRRTGTPGKRAWTNFAGVPLTGLAHGAAGIALALRRLHAATHDERFMNAALEAIAYERATYDPHAGNWPDFRALATRDGVPGYSVMWCHGAPGIGLARLAMPYGEATFAGDDDVSEIDAAVAATIAFGVRGPDYLCCGNLGRAELLLQAGVQLQRP